MKNKNLIILLASMSHLYAKLQNYHWNVKGKRFFSLHKAFEGMYENKKDFIDAVAERIVQLNGTIDATFKQYLQMSIISEPDCNKTDMEMLQDLIISYKAIDTMLHNLKKEYNEDCCTSVLLDDCIGVITKELWMMNSSVDE